MLRGRQAILFDFDGVLVDSVDVKTQGFAALYRGEAPEIVREVVRYHLAHGGVSRFEKIRYYERKLLGRLPDDARVDALAERFAHFVVEAVIASPEVPGANALLAALAAEGTPLHIASGTPEEELKMIVARRGLTDRFVSVHGAPRKKDEILRGVIAEHGYSAADCLMVGDATTDYEAAKAAGLLFLGVVRPGTDNPFPPGTPVVADFLVPADALQSL